jgi:hypothetical protein
VIEVTFDEETKMLEESMKKFAENMSVDDAKDFLSHLSMFDENGQLKSTVDGESYIQADGNGCNYYFLFSLLEYEEIPIVFVAENDEGHLCLCDCVEFFNKQVWIITETTYPILISVAKQELSVFDALKCHTDTKTVVIYDYETKKFTHEQTKFNMIDKMNLPEKDVMLRYIDDFAREILLGKKGENQ